MSVSEVKTLGKLFNVGGNALTRQVKRLEVGYAGMTAQMKDYKKSVIGSGINSGVMAGLTAVQYAEHPIAAVISGLASVVSGLVSGFNFRDFLKAKKAKAEVVQSMKDMISKPEFMDIANRYLKIKGKKSMSTEEVVKILEEVYK